MSAADRELLRRKQGHEGEADQDCRTIGNVKKQVNTDCQKSPGYHYLQCPEPENQPPHPPQACRSQLYANDEQQQDDAQLGQLADLGNLVDQREPGRTDENSRHKKSGDCPKTRRTKYWDGNDGCRQQDNDVQKIVGHHSAASFCVVPHNDNS